MTNPIAACVEIAASGSGLISSELFILLLCIVLELGHREAAGYSGDSAALRRAFLPAGASGKSAPLGSARLFGEYFHAADDSGSAALFGRGLRLPLALAWLTAMSAAFTLSRAVVLVAEREALDADWQAAGVNGVFTLRWLLLAQYVAWPLAACPALLRLAVRARAAVPP